MQKAPAYLGWLWIKEGFALFRKQPAALSSLFLSYMVLMLVAGIIPLLGQILPIIFIPVFSMLFMQACVCIEQDQQVNQNLLLNCFRSPTFRPLLQLGGFYLLAMLLAAGASSLADGGLFLKVISGQIPVDAKTINDGDMSLGMLIAAIVYTPAAMAFWYAAPLIVWQKMGIGKAIFYSFFSVHRAGKAFLVYGLAWAAIGILLPAIASVIVLLMFNQAIIAMMVLLPLSIMLTIIMYCSFYPTYTHVFGKPDVKVEIQ